MPATYKDDARQERVLALRSIVRQQKALIAAKREHAAERQRGRYHHLQTHNVCVRCGTNYAIPGQTLCVKCAVRNFAK